MGEYQDRQPEGEQPKFTAYAMAPDGPRHVIVKFSELEESAISERWRDLLLAEHIVLDTLHQAGIPAAKTRIVDCNGQRFPEVERFDRSGSLGRRAHSSPGLLQPQDSATGSSPASPCLNTTSKQPVLRSNGWGEWLIVAPISMQNMENMKRS